MKATVEKYAGNPLQAVVVIEIENTDGATVSYTVFDEEGRVALKDDKWLLPKDILKIVIGGK